MIASVRSAVDKPTYSGEETTSPLNSLLANGFGFKFSVPITDDITFSVGFELPVSNYWPKITASPSGVIVSFGSQMTDPSEKMPGNWKSADAKNYDNLLKEWENQEYLAWKESEIGAAYDYYKSSYTNFVQKTQLALGWFGLFSARWQEDEDFDTWLCTVSGSTGLILTFSYDITYPFSIGPVPLYANLNIALSAGFCFGLNAEFAMMHGDFTNVRFTAFPALTIELAFAITFSLGIGIKGLISVYISGTACLNLAIAVITDAPPTVSPSFSAFVKVGVEMLFFSESLIIMMYPSSQTTGGGTLFSLFMSRALADDEPEQAEVVSQTPFRYPDLAPNAQKVLGDMKNVSHSVLIENAAGSGFAFYLGGVSNQSGTQIHWQNLTGGSSGVIDLSDTGDSRLRPYCFDTYTDGDNIYLLACLADPFSSADALPKDDGQTVFRGYMAAYTIGGDGGLEPAGSVTFNPEDGLSYRSLANPHIERASLDGGLNMLSSFGQIADYGTGTGIVTCEEGGNVVFHPADSVTCSMNDHYYSAVYPLFTGSYHFESSDKASFIGLAEPDASTNSTLSAIDLVDKDTLQLPEDSRQSKFYLIPGRFDSIGLIQSEDPDGRYSQRVFFTDKTNKDEESGNDDGNAEIVRYQLKSVHISPRELNEDYRWAEYHVSTMDYDVFLPASGFKITYVADMPIFYWLDTAPAEKRDDPVVWRINGVAYDPASDTMSDVFVLSEFTLPDSSVNGAARPTIPTGVALTETGYGYLTTMPEPDEGTSAQPMSLYSFPLTMKPVLEFQGLTLSETLVTPGQMIDATFSLMNKGDISATGFDLELVQVMDDGSEGPVLETLHTDCLNPENNYLMSENGGIILKGPEVCYRDEDYVFSGRKRDWSTSSNDMVFRFVNGDPQNPDVGPDESNYLKTEVLIPGSLASFTASIKVPNESSWSGDIMLRLRVSQIFSYTNTHAVTMAAALAGKNGAFTLPAGAKALVWTRNKSTGRLELRDAGLTGTEQSLYARDLSVPGASAPLKVEHQDIAVDYRMGKDSYGEPMLDIIVANQVNNRSAISLTCAVYPDGSKTPYYVSLPYYAEYVSAGKTQTISMPLTTLADPSKYSTVRVVLRGLDVEESALSNNEFTLNLRGLSSGTFKIIRQPEDTIVNEGETASFTVDVAGGITPYTYRWEVRMGENDTWQKLSTGNEPTLTLKDTKMHMNGWKYRCVITDASGKTVTSREALLTVVRVPPTGDSSNLPLYLLLAMAALALLWMLRTRRTAGKN